MVYEFKHPVVVIIFEGNVKDYVSKHPSVCFCSLEKGNTFAIISTENSNRDTIRLVKNGFKKYGKIVLIKGFKDGAEIVKIMPN